MCVESVLSCASHILFNYSFAIFFQYEMASNIAIESKGTAIEGDLLDKLRTQLSVKANQGRDWRWLFRRINLPNRDISTFERSIDPIGDIFTECHAEQIYIARLRNILQNIGVGDAIESIDHDIGEWQNN